MPGRGLGEGARGNEDGNLERARGGRGAAAGRGSGGEDLGDMAGDGGGEGVEGIAGRGGGKGVEAADGGAEFVLDGAHSAGEGAGGVEIGGELEALVGVAVEEGGVNAFAVLFGGVAAVDQDGKGEFAFGGVGAEGFAGVLGGADEVEAIVVNLVSHAQPGAVFAEGGDGVGGLAGEVTAELGGDAEERGGFHADDAEVFLDGEGEVELAAGLEDFTLAHFVRGAGDGAGDIVGVESGAKFEGVGEEAVAEEDGEFRAPFCGGGGGAAAEVGAVHDIVVDKGGEVDELDDGGEADVVFGDTAGGGAGEEGEGGADAFAAGLAGVGNVRDDGGVEGGGLGAYLAFDCFEVGGDFGEGGGEIEAGGDDGDGVGARGVRADGESRFGKHEAA